MAKIKGTILVDKERCKGCGVCVASCPCDVLHLSAEETAKVTPWLRWLIRMPAQDVRPARLSVRTVASRFIVKNLNKLWQRKK